MSDEKPQVSLQGLVDQAMRDQKAAEEDHMLTSMWLRQIRQCLWVLSQDYSGSGEILSLSNRHYAACVDLILATREGAWDAEVHDALKSELDHAGIPYAKFDEWLTGGMPTQPELEFGEVRGVVLFHINDLRGMVWVNRDPVPPGPGASVSCAIYEFTTRESDEGSFLLLHQNVVMSDLPLTLSRAISQGPAQ